MEQSDFSNLDIMMVGTEQVSFYSRVWPGAGTGISFTPQSPYTLYNAKRYEETRTTTGPGSSRKSTLDWEFYYSDLAAAGAPNPKRDDRIVDAAGIGWTIKDIATNEMQNAFLCSCIKEVPVNQNIN